MDHNSVKLLDGGFSSQLSQYVNFDAEYANHPLWCAQFLINNPNFVVETHRDYIKAGAEIITTNTYQASTEGFQKYFQLSYQDSYEVIKSAVQLAKKAVLLENNSSSRTRVLIAGSVGSYGAFLHDGSEYNENYSKNVSREFFKNWHRPRISALIEGGVDYLAIETIPSLTEAEAIMDLLCREFPNQKAWVSFTCKNEKQTVALDEISYAANKLWTMHENQLVAIGVNCLNPSFALPLITSIRTANTKKGSFIPTIVYPNSGEHFDAEKQKWMKLPGSPSIHSYLTSWLDNKISIIGGCCRTTAEDIKMFKYRVEEFNEKNSNINQNN